MSLAIRIAIAEADPDVREFLERSIPRFGHVVSSVARTGQELVEHSRRSLPDLIIADMRMPGMTGLEAVEIVNRVSPVPTILLTVHSCPEWIDQARGLGVMAYLVKPVTENHLAPAIALARHHFLQLQALRRESAELRQALDDRKIIERAKGVTTRRTGVSENEAYRRMRKLATDGSRKLIDVAHQIITAEEVFRALDSMGNN